MSTSPFRVGLSIAFFVLVVPRSALAQAPLDLPPLEVATGVSPDDALAFEALLEALNTSPRRRAAEAESEAAHARIDRARVLPSPRLRGGVASVDISGASAPTVTTLELSVPIEYSGRVDARIDQAVALEDAQRALLAEVELGLSAEAAARYADAIEAALIHRTRLALAARAERIALLVQRRIELGDGSELDAAAARIEIARLRAEVVTAEGALGAAGVALAELLGSFEREPLATGSLLFDEPGPMLEARIAEALAARPDLLALRRAVESREHAREERHRSRAPELSVYVGWQHSFESLGSLFNQPEYDALMFGLDVEIPVRLAWDGELREADAELAAREAEVAGLELGIRREIHAAARAYATARARTRALEAALVDVRLAAELVTRTLELGEERVLGVLAAERHLGEAIETYQRALGEEARRYLSLERALGHRIEHWPGR